MGFVLVFLAAVATLDRGERELPRHAANAQPTAGRRQLAAQPRGHAAPDGVARQLPATLLISDGSARHSLP